eukprot:779375-Pyramimonas_sp.AAC.1
MEEAKRSDRAGSPRGNQLTERTAGGQLLQPRWKHFGVAARPNRRGPSHCAVLLLAESTVELA